MTVIAESERIDLLEEQLKQSKRENEHHIAEIHAKHILLTRKGERIEELLQELTDRDAQISSLSMQCENQKESVLQANERIQMFEEENEMIHATLASVQADREKLAQSEANLKHELATSIKALSRRREVKTPSTPSHRPTRKLEKADVCLSPRSFSENQLIALRDEAIEAKTKEVWILSGQNNRLMVQLNDLESALEELQSNYTTQEQMLLKKQRRIQNLEGELGKIQKQLSVVSGQHQALDIAAAQNTSLLRALETQEHTKTDIQAKLALVEEERDALRTEVQKYHLKLSTAEAETFVSATKAEHSSTSLQQVQQKWLQERQSLREELAEVRLQHQVELEHVRSELVMRRNKQYDLTLRLQNVEAELQEVKDVLEATEQKLCYRESCLQETTRSLQASIEKNRALETEAADTKSKLASTIETHESFLSDKDQEMKVLQSLAEEQQDKISKQNGANRGWENRVKSLHEDLFRLEALNKEQSARIKRLVDEAARESKLKEEARTASKAAEKQLQVMKDHMEKLMKDADERVQVATDKCNKFKSQVRLLEIDQQYLSSATRRLVQKLMDLLSVYPCSETPESVLQTLHSLGWFARGHLELRDCAIDNDDLKLLCTSLVPLADVMQVLDLQGNWITDESIACVAGFLHRLFRPLRGHTNVPNAYCLKKVNLRNNCISLVGIRSMATALERLTYRTSNMMGSKSSTKTMERLFHRVSTSLSGCIECYENDSNTVVLTIDIGNSNNVRLPPEKLPLQVIRSSVTETRIPTIRKDISEIYEVDLVKTFMPEVCAPSRQSGGPELVGLHRRNSADLSSPQSPGTSNNDNEIASSFSGASLPSSVSLPKLSI